MKKLAYWVNVTDMCNLKCTYCYQNNRKNRHMSFETADKIISHIVNHNVTDIELSFFGGEPLLNFEVIEHIVNSLKRYNFSSKYVLTTNLTVFNQKILDFLIEHNFSIMISIDGDKEVYNLNRIGDNGKDYYSIVYNNILEIKKTDYNKITLSKVVTNNNCYKLYSDTKFLLELNFPIFYNIDFKHSLDKKSNIEFIEQLEHVYIGYITNKEYKGKLLHFDNFISAFKMMFFAGEYQEQYNCNSKENYIITFNTQGVIYPCHFMIEMYEELTKEFTSSSIEEMLQKINNNCSFNSLRSEEVYNELLTILNRECCINCEYRYYCYKNSINVIKNMCHLNKFKLRNNLRLRTGDEREFCIKKFIFNINYSLINERRVSIDDII